MITERNWSRARAAALAVIAAIAIACGGGGGGDDGSDAPNVSIITGSLPSGIQGTTYGTLLVAENGTAPYSWTLAKGSLPQGLTLSSAGVISGLPSARSTSSFTVRVKDSAEPAVTGESLLSITINAAPLRIVNSRIAPGYIGLPFKQQLLASGGIPPYEWSSTSLPVGLTLSAGGLLSGTPIAEGTNDVTFTVKDSVAETTSKTFSMTIKREPPVRVRGTLTFDKVPVAETGLDFTGTYTTPIRSCLVGLEDLTNPGFVFSTAYTDRSGNYSLPSPDNSNVRVLVYALCDTGAGSLTVVDRSSESDPKPTWTAASPPFIVTSVDLTGANWNVADSMRVNGAFNIVDVVYDIQQQILAANPATSFGDAVIEWSPDFYPGTSYFSGSTGVIQGDRETDSDDFDDAVIAHEYSHYLQTALSRDDSTGGRHYLGQVLDPRVAFGEGEATFLALYFIKTPLYIDTYSTDVLLIDAEGEPTTDQGYWNEVSVAKVLWDCFDAANEPGDSLTLPFSLNWVVFTEDIKQHTLVYLIDFMDSLYARSPSSGAGMAAILATEGITYMPGAHPSVPNPWPTFLHTGVAKSGTLDGTLEQQWNVMSSTAAYYITIPAAKAVTVTLKHTGEGTTPVATDYVTVYVFNDRGHGYYPDGELFGTSLAPNGKGYTTSMTVNLPAGGTYAVIATTCYPYPPASGESPWIFSSADYQITATY